MEFIGLGIVGIGFLISFVGGIMFLIAAFRESVLWGLAVIFVPFASLAFLIIHWQEAKKAFLLQIVGVILSIMAAVLMPNLISQSNTENTTTEITP